MGKQDKIQQERRTMIEMYKAGFSDACKRWDSKTQKRCFKAFKKRFIDNDTKDK